MCYKYFPWDFSAYIPECFIYIYINSHANSPCIFSLFSVLQEIWLEVTEAYKVLTNPKRNRRDRSNGFKQGPGAAGTWHGGGFELGSAQWL